MNFDLLRDVFASLSNIQPYFGEVPYLEVYASLNQFSSQYPPESQKKTPLLVTSEEREDMWVTATNHSLEPGEQA